MFFRCTKNVGEVSRHKFARQACCSGIPVVLSYNSRSSVLRVLDRMADRFDKENIDKKKDAESFLKVACLRVRALQQAFRGSNYLVGKH